MFIHTHRWISVIGLRAHLDTERGWQLVKRAVRQQRAVSPVPGEFARGRLAFSAHLQWRAVGCAEYGAGVRPGHDCTLSRCRNAIRLRRRRRPPRKQSVPRPSHCGENHLGERAHRSSPPRASAARDRKMPAGEQLTEPRDSPLMSPPAYHAGPMPSPARDSRMAEGPCRAAHKRGIVRAGLETRQHRRASAGPETGPLCEQSPAASQLTKSGRNRRPIFCRREKV